MIPDRVGAAPGGGQRHGRAANALLTPYSVVGRRLNSSRGAMGGIRQRRVRRPHGRPTRHNVGGHRSPGHRVILLRGRVGSPDPRLIGAASAAFAADLEPRRPGLRAATGLNIDVAKGRTDRGPAIEQDRRGPPLMAGLQRIRRHWSSTANLSYRAWSELATTEESVKIATAAGKHPGVAPVIARVNGTPSDRGARDSTRRLRTFGVCRDPRRTRRPSASSTTPRPAWRETCAPTQAQRRSGMTSALDAGVSDAGAPHIGPTRSRR